MCVAIAKPAKVRIPKRVLAAAFVQNPDGAGFAWYDEDSEVVWEHKGFWDFKTFWAAYRLHEHQNVLIHCRAATHGAKSNENCHPFRVGDSVVMAHNGVISDYIPVGKDDRSDTRIFAEELVMPILAKVIDPVDFVHDPRVRKMLREMVGWGNKLVFLTPNGFAFVREEMGDWVGGAWYSSGNPLGRWHRGEDDDYGYATYYPGGNQKPKFKVKVHDFRSGKPPYGTKEYSDYMLAEGYVRDGNAWVWKASNKTKVVRDLNKPPCPHCGFYYSHDSKCASGNGDIGITDDERKSWLRLTDPDPPDQDKDEDEGMDDVAPNSDEAIRARMRGAIEPSNGSRPRDPATAQESLQLALGPRQSDAPTSEEDAPLAGWELWLAAQEDLDPGSTYLDPATTAHNRAIILKGLEKAPKNGVIYNQLLDALVDLNERERAATELAQEGYN